MIEDLSKSQQVVQLAATLGVLRPRDLIPHGIQAEYLRRLCDRGQLKKVGRGSYIPAGTRLDGRLALAVAARAVPNGVICLQSALAFHGLHAHDAHAVHIAIERRAAQPRLDHPRLHVIRLGDEAFTEGVEHHEIAQVPVALYGLEKTLTDLFKFRNKIGPHIAVDALRDALRKRRVDLEALWHYARIGRVERVMRPYVEALARKH